MTNKTVAERLREIANGKSLFPGCELLAIVATGSARCRQDTNTCTECKGKNLKDLADMIEAEQAELRNQSVDIAALDLLCEKLDWGNEYQRSLAGQIRKEMKGVTGSKLTPLSASNSMPLDADGEPCWLDDAVWHKGHKHLVVAVSHKGKVCIRDWGKRNSGEGAVWVKADLVTHRKPDTQEDIDADAAKRPCQYFGAQSCRECPQGHADGSDIDYDECCIAQIRDLLERQRKLMGGE